MICCFDKLGWMRKSRVPTPITPTGLTRSRHANAIPPARCSATAYLLRAIELIVIDAEVSINK